MVARRTNKDWVDLGRIHRIKTGDEWGEFFAQYPDKKISAESAKAFRVSGNPYVNVALKHQSPERQKTSKMQNTGNAVCIYRRF